MTGEWLAPLARTGANHAEMRLGGCVLGSDDAAIFIVGKPHPGR